MTALTMDAATVKAALRRRHPAQTIGSMTGQWTCIEEWEQVDLIALNAWADADVIGYEVKVSRSDYRAELLQPAKRSAAVAMCTEFYFAVPAGLLKAEEIAYVEPEWEPDDWHRVRCIGMPTFGPPDDLAARFHRPADLLDTPPGRYGGQCHGRGWTGTYKAGTREKGPFTLCLPVPVAVTEFPGYIEKVYEFEAKRHGSEDLARLAARADHLADRIRSSEASVPCPTCGGKGYLAKSRVEAEAPTLWVPRDVGLIEVHAGGSRVVRKSPKRHDAPGLLPVVANGADARSQRRARQRAHQLLRWVSNRPDPRHALPVGSVAA